VQLALAAYHTVTVVDYFLSRSESQWDHLQHSVESPTSQETQSAPAPLPRSASPEASVHEWTAEENRSANALLGEIEMLAAARRETMLAPELAWQTVSELRTAASLVAQDFPRWSDRTEDARMTMPAVGEEHQQAPTRLRLGGGIRATSSTSSTRRSREARRRRSAGPQLPGSCSFGSSTGHVAVGTAPAKDARPSADGRLRRRGVASFRLLKRRRWGSSVG